MLPLSSYAPRYLSEIEGFYLYILLSYINSRVQKHNFYVGQVGPRYYVSGFEFHTRIQVHQ